MVCFLSKLFTDFKRDERGSFAIFLLSIFTTMTLVAGAAVDLARFEVVRSSIQYNLDRSVLAAASMRQTRAPEAIVRDYMSKVDALSSFNVAMDNENTSVSVTGRRVSATATATLSTYFLRIAGINTMDVIASSKAFETIPHLEVSLVLDVSSSMLGGQINSLKVAANEFVDTVITEEDNTRTSISIVPYATNVSVPQSMWDNYATEDLSENSRCIIFDDDDYDVTAIDPWVTQRQLPYYSPRGTFHSGLEYEDCNVAAWSEILPLETSKAALHAKINALVASGDSNADNTAGHIGAKWGAALLDPAASHMGSGTFPTAYGERDVLKVMVVMTDGQNTNHYELYDGYRTGLSDMYAVFPDTSANFSEYVYKAETGLYYERNGDSLGDSHAELPSGNKVLQYTWSEVWELMSTEGYGRLIDDDNDHAIERIYSTRAEADDQMIRACSTAKSQGIKVYTISFKVTPRESKEIFKQCATSLSYYYDVDETDIGTAFASIAVSIQKLKLTH